MHWSQRVNFMLGMPVCVSFTDGSWVSGVLCTAQNGVIHVIECINQNQFITNEYPYYRIMDITAFPSCNPMAGIMPF